MQADDHDILDAVIVAVTRYGMKRSTMGDLAQSAGVSRQTLYDKYRDKDGIMAAAIRLISDRVCKDLRTSFAALTDLSDKIDAYYDIAVWPTFKAMQAMPDAADFERGLGPASIGESERHARLKQDMLTEIFSDLFDQRVSAPADIAHFFETTSANARKTCSDEATLNRILIVLKASTLALAKERGR